MSPESRSRLISFRLNADEYDKFHELCLTHGIRSVSEMARTAINLLLQQPARIPQESLEARVSDLEGRVHILTLDIRKLNSQTT